MRLAVTGSSGKLGRSVVAGLKEAGHDVLGLDLHGERGPEFLSVDLTRYGDVIDALMGVDDRHSGFDAVVHLAAIPAPGLQPDAATFHNNMLATYNVFQACRRAGVQRIVYASSETVLGLPFDEDPPYIPVDEEYDARITALRFSNVMDPEDYAAFPSFDSDPLLRKWNLWGYIDGRDGAQAVLRALENAPNGFDRFIIAASDTVMSRSSASLAAEVFPNVEMVREVGEHETLLSIDRARRVLGFEPQHSWRNHAGG
jgi:UDP-glucose 4-epimerase